jgi:hypothetical protein
MITEKQEAILLPIIQSFVASLDGGLSEFVSDKFLEQLLLYGFNKNHRFDQDCSRAKAILNGVSGIAYDVACPIFENLLEHGCGSCRSGHAIARDFARHCAERLKEVEV